LSIVHRPAIVVSVLVFLSLLLPAAVATAQDAAPATSPVASQPLDLAAMVLTPANLEAVGLTGFGQQAAVFSEVADSADAETAGGRQRVYHSRLAVPVDPGATSDRFRTLVSTAIDAYADAAAAAAGFALLETKDTAGEGTPVLEDIAGTRTVGDQSRVTRQDLESPDGRAYVQLELAFQRGPLVARVGIADYTGQELDLSNLETLAETVLVKMDAVVAGGGPGLQPRTLHLIGQDLLTTFALYNRIAGETIPNYNATSEQTAAATARLGNATDSYAVAQQLTGGTDDQTDDGVFTLSSVTRFPTPEAASTWLRAGQERLANLSTFYLDVAPVDGALAMGDESAAFSVTVGGGEARYNGFVSYVRVDRDVAAVRLLTQAATPLEVVVELAQAQVDCLQSTAACAPIPVPAALAALAVPATLVAATPVP
jgi:hypothetical protein